MSFDDPTRHPFRPVAIVLLFVLILAGCSSSGPSTPSKSAATAPTTSAKAVSATCPTAAQIASAAGTTFPAPQAESSSGTLLCNYNSTTTDVNMVLEISSAPGTSASALKAAADSQAQSQNTPVAPVSGLGDAAYMLTKNDASTNASGVATTILMILDGSKIIDITAEMTPTQVQAVGHYVLSH